MSLGNHTRQNYPASVIVHNNPKYKHLQATVNG